MKHLALSLLLSASFALAQPTRPSVEDRLWNDLTSTLGAFEFKCPDDGYSDAITLCAAYRGDHAFLSNVVNLIEPTYGVGKGSFAEMTPWQPWGRERWSRTFGMSTSTDSPEKWTSSTTWRGSTSW